jgi:hypothetical protein
MNRKHKLSMLLEETYRLSMSMKDIWQQDDYSMIKSCSDIWKMVVNGYWVYTSLSKGSEITGKARYWTQESSRSRNPRYNWKANQAKIGILVRYLNDERLFEK